VLWGEQLWVGIPFIPVVRILNISVRVTIFSSATTTNLIKCFGFIKKIGSLVMGRTHLHTMKLEYPRRGGNEGELSDENK
jgi:hypothetical protein